MSSLNVRRGIAVAVVLLVGCASTLGINDLEKVDCVGDSCDGGGGAETGVEIDGSTPGDDAGTGSETSLDDATDGTVSVDSKIGGNVSGLVGTGLQLQNNGGDTLAITASGPFAFPKTLPQGQTFAVTILAQPSNPVQACSISGGSGTVGAGDVTSVVVNCDPDKHTVGGSVSGLSGPLVLQNNGGDNVIVSGSGSFAFSTPIANGAAYAVTIASQPVGQTCTVNNGSGTMGTANVSNVSVTCSANTYTVGGTISGLTGTVFLLNNGGNSLSVSASGSFTFSAPIAYGSMYAVTVGTQPSNQMCTVTNGSGTMSANNVTNVSVSCVSTLDGGCASTNTTTNCSKCGATCDTSVSTGASCNGTTCLYSSCMAGHIDCNTTAPNTDGCECVSPACCANGAVAPAGPTAACQPQHNNGLGKTFYECTPLGTFNAQLALAACAAYTGDVSKCVSGQCVGGGSPVGTVCSQGYSTCACWNYEGSYAGYVRSTGSSSCACPGSTSYPKWQ